MDDRFKFRVWKQDSWGYNLKNEFVKQKPHYEYFELNNNIIFMKNDIIEQSTGLKDKNGKLIYDGDIVKLKDYHNVIRIVQIFYSESMATFMYGGDGYSDEYFFNSYDREVIGNIHENPELLEANND